jgi:hypothetical protein
MRREKLFPLMVFACLVYEDEAILAYYNAFWTPARLLGWFMYVWPFKLSLFELACLLILMFGRRGAPIARPLTRAVQASALALVACVLYGMFVNSDGGTFKPVYTQAFSWGFCLVFTMAAAKSLSTVEDFRRLENAIVWAGVWRACMAIIFFMKVRHLWGDARPQQMTTHEDTMLWVVALVILISRAIELRTRQALRPLLWAVPLFITAIQVNNRRLAWASLAASLFVLYAMLPARSRVTKRVNRWLLLASPVLVLYVAIGMGRTETIFKPLAAFSSMGAGQEDKSTKARENENTSLITMIAERPLLGTGFGHEWIELDDTYTVPVSAFPLYHYCPHNSVLSLLAFCGGLGFAGLWLVIPVSAYLNARTYRRAEDPRVRSVAIIGIVEVVTYLNQAYGDMGAMGPTHIPPATILGCGMAVAARMSVASGAWPSPSTARAGRVPATAAREPSAPAQA